MRLVTIRAPHVLALVCSTRPEAVLLLGVAILTDPVFALLRPWRVRAESRHRRAFLAGTNPAGMIAAGAMAGLALITAERRAFIRHDAMRPLEDCIEMGAVFVAMAAQAPIGTSPRVLLWHVAVAFRGIVVLGA